MTQKAARAADTILKHFAANQNRSFSVTTLSQLFGITANHAQDFINLFLSDGYIAHVQHPGAPEHDFGVYFITNKGAKFIAFDGGYLKKRRYDSYKHQNIRFTWIRHWAWFFAFAVSLCINIYLLIFA